MLSSWINILPPTLSKLPFPPTKSTVVNPSVPLETTLDIVGAVEGPFFITVMCSSFTKPLATPSTISIVLEIPSSSVPRIHLGMFIFLGSVSLSVQNNISSMMFIPVIILLGLKFNTGCFKALQAEIGAVNTACKSKSEIPVISGATPT